MTTLNMQLLLRRDEVFTSTYVLAKGEPGFEITTNTLKIGDGTKTWAELPIANKEAIDALIKVVDDKVKALGDTYATDDELAAGLALKADLETYNTYVADRQLTDTQINEAVAGAKTHAETKISDFNTNTVAPIAADVATIKSDYVKAADIANFETKENVKAVADDLAAYVESNDAAVALKADKSVVEAMYTNEQIDGFIEAAKKYADDNDADTTYGLTYDSDNKKIKLVAGGTDLEIDATEFIKDGMIETVTIGDDNDLVITFNTAAGKENIVLPLDQLVDIYTGKVGDRVTVTVASDKSISADLVAGSISKNYLDSDVQASLGKADSALQAADLDDYAKTDDVTSAISEAVAPKLDTATFNEFNNGTSKTVAAIEADIVAKANAAQAAAEATAAADATAKANKALEDAKAYADGKEHKNTTYTAAATANALEFTLTPSEGEAQTITLVAPTVDTGVMDVTAGTDIVVTPGENGAVQVAHASYQTGTIKAVEGTEEPNFVTSVTIANGHVTGATVQTLKAALESMSFVLDGGNSTTA